MFKKPEMLRKDLKSSAYVIQLHTSDVKEEKASSFAVKFELLSDQNWPETPL